MALGTAWGGMGPYYLISALYCVSNDFTGSKKDHPEKQTISPRPAVTLCTGADPGFCERGVWT